MPKSVFAEQEYNKKQKEHEELLKWTGNMTSQDLIELYNGDPCQYFYDKVTCRISRRSGSMYDAPEYF
jgi:hypothetical protein